MKYWTGIVVASLLQIFLIVSASSAQGLTHVCKNQKIVGRAIYSCEAQSGIKSAMSALTPPEYKSYSKLKKYCSVSCATNSKCKEGDKKCAQSCPSNCEADFYKKASKTMLGHIKNYQANCDISNGGSKCEQSEAKPYCDSSIYSSAKKINNPKTFNDYKRVMDLYTRVLTKYNARAGNLDGEVEGYSAEMRKKINEEVGCELEPKSHTICSSPLKTVNFNTALPSYYSIIAARTKKQGSSVCNQGKGCVADACTQNRDDNAYTTEADGSTCYCDEYCCEAGDCCGNFTTACKGVVDVAKCSAAATAPKMMSVDYEYLRSLKKRR